MRKPQEQGFQPGETVFVDGMVGIVYKTKKTLILRREKVTVELPLYWPLNALTYKGTYKADHVMRVKQDGDREIAVGNGKQIDVTNVYTENHHPELVLRRIKQKGPQYPHI